MGKDWDKLDGANYASVTPGNNSPHARQHSVNFLGSPNPTCRKCGWLRSLNTEGSGGRKKCRCEKPDFPEYRTPAMKAMQAWHYGWLKLCYERLPPGGVIKAFSATRTFHRLAAAMEDAGFVDLDIEAWNYGSGFPKSLDVSKAIDSHLGKERPVIGANPRAAQQTGQAGTDTHGDRKAASSVTTGPGSPEAADFDGYGTALKPAWEPFIVASKPV